MSLDKATANISIHAPTRGATIDVLLNSASAQFQSTLPRGERHITGATTCSRLNFNPRSHEGSDNGDFLSFPQSKDFNPRSHEGSDAGVATSVSSAVDFNPRSHEGSDHRLIGA